MPSGNNPLVPYPAQNFNTEDICGKGCDAGKFIFRHEITFDFKRVARTDIFAGTSVVSCLGCNAEKWFLKAIDT